jgi:hypothetical protein
MFIWIQFFVYINMDKMSIELDQMLEHMRTTISNVFNTHTLQ